MGLNGNRDAASDSIRVGRAGWSRCAFVSSSRNLEVVERLDIFRRLLSIRGDLRPRFDAR
jgi:hypothetical protein